jgi:uncharacterized membrane-anchored protein
MKRYLAVVVVFSSFYLFAQDKAEILAKIKQQESKLHYQQGTIELKGGIATLTVPENFRYLGPDDAGVVLSQFWGNPDDEKTLGMILPAGISPLSSNCWAVVITYTADGYVKDADADKINYTDLLKKMQKGTADYNKERTREGYPSMELVGWATPPRYDKATHKMYWAKELKIDDSPENTLNYNIRVLGRRGVLVLNAVASMSQLPLIEENTPAIVGMVDFKEGNRYADFDGKTDKVAAYGLAALVAGGIAAKAGFFKLFWIGLLALKKFVIIGVVALVAFVKRLFGKRAST